MRNPKDSIIKTITTKLDNLVDFDFSRFKLPSLVTKLKPLLFKNKNCYYAILPMADVDNIEGFGQSPEDALIDWNDRISAHLLNSSSALRNKLMGNEPER
ncbi:hypothetical protein [Pedobacter aquatilis]|uniref:hypothetical protein n=1 Tax=Pedobacter aquatilis TaxID=351343 RepID=UPI002930A219|nr:hypothetical protein [Pedobacter aquatilis]